MRRKQKGDDSSRVTVYVDADMNLMIDQWQNQFGIDSRGLAALAMMKAGSGLVPLNSATFALVHAAVTEHRKALNEATVRFFEEQLAVYRGHKV